MNRRTLQLLFALSVCLSLWISLDAQGLPDGPVNILSPETAAFAKSGNVPVGTYTGTANIGIALLTIQDGPISVPLSLGYNSSGIKVQEEASWVGLGFNLSAGGQISRVIRGGDDFLNQPDYYNYASAEALGKKVLFTNDGFNGDEFQRYFTNALPAGPPSPGYHVYLNTTAGSMDMMSLDLQPYNYDWVPDLFYYTAGNSSGKFELDDYGNPMELKKSNTKITLFDGNSFQVTTEDGLIYTYDLRDHNSSMIITSPDVTNTWLLTSIRSADSNHIVSFKYGSGSMQTNTVTTQKATGYSNGTVISTALSNYNIVSYGYLTEIDFRGGKVLFQSSANRTDVTGARRLDSLVQYDSLGVRTKKFSFKYSYFHATNASPGTPLLTDRLRLDSVLQNDDVHVSYRMTYDTTNVPVKAAGQDHWGYYNNTGVGIPQGIYPQETVLPGGTGVTIYQAYGGGDYDAQWPYTQSMILNKLTYPTGGYSKFTYEPNEFGNVPDYWQYDASSIPPPPVALVYPVTSVDNGTVSISNPSSSPLNLYCNFYCDDPSDLYDFDIDFLTPTGTVVTSRQLSQFTHVGNWYTLNVTGLLLNDGYVCHAYSSRPNHNVSSSDMFQFFTLNLTGMGVTDPNSLIRKNLTRMAGGGLRIKKIDNYDGIKETSYKQYQYNHPDGSSSGVMMNFPIYCYNAVAIGVHSPLIGFAYDYFSSTSVIGLSTSAGGSFVGYDHVTEITGDSVHNIGSTEYQYINFPDRTPFQYGFDIPCVQSVENGLLLQKINYDANHIRVSELDNTYSAFNDTWKSTTGVRMVPSAGRPEVSTPLNDGFAGPIFAWRDYQLDYKLLASTESVYDSKSLQTAVQSSTSYVYGDNMRPRKVSKSSSTGIVDQAEYRYADDFSLTSAPPFIQEMAAYNIIDRPIEVVQSKVNGGTNMAVGGQLVEFGTGGSRGLVKNQYKLDIAAPLSWGDGNFSSALSGASFVYNSNYALKQSFKYVQGNISDYSTLLTNTAYVWAYDQRYPVAECTNATSNEVYVENFEENAAGGVVSGTAHTGSYFYSGAFTVNWTRPDSRTYVISYWYRSGGVWKLSAPAAYTGPTQALSGGDAYDDIRIYPSDAQLTTFTYQPLVGITSKSDANSLATFYEYDGFGRLMLIRDQDGNIIKTIDYHYQGQ